MNLVVWLVVGGVMGGLASALIRREGSPAIVMNLMMGVAGALAGGWFLSPLVGGSTADQVAFSGVALVASVVGAALLLTITNLVDRQTSQSD